MSSERKMEVTQLDEIWQVATNRWGDPGARHPKPDRRFEELRDLLRQIETLFAEDESSLELRSSHEGIKIAKKKKFQGRRMISSDPDEDEEGEIPF